MIKLKGGRIGETRFVPPFLVWSGK